MFHGGNLRALAEQAGCAPSEILDFSANINPLGPPEWLRRTLGARVSELVHYPDPACAELTAAACGRYGVAPNEVVCGNGVSDLIAWLPRVLRGRGFVRAVIPTPAYAEYQPACERAGLAVETLPLRPENDFGVDLAALAGALEAGPAVVFVGQPSNPAGALAHPQALRELALANPECMFVIDEAFADFVPGLDRLTRNRLPNMAVLLSLTKILAVPGLRVGLGVLDANLANELRQALPPWSVNVLAQGVGERGLRDEEYIERSALAVENLRTEFAAGLGAMPGLRVFPGAANYLLCRLEGDRKAEDLFRHCLLKHRLAIRIGLPGLDEAYFRVAVKAEHQNARLLDAVAEFLSVPRSVQKPRTPAVMILGCSSDAGKSVLAAGLCRVFKNMGLNPLPFKAQNMSLNSGVTAAGGEMGRAQMLQAVACGVEPEARMNPVLLKPTGDTGSQVIVLGKPVAQMRVREYVREKPKLWASVAKAYDELAARAGIMVLEGAGSPAEVNLKAHDIVNMRMAVHADATVILVADIDRGGSFAHLLGTMDCLTEAERDRVCGFVLNKFRGDESLLADANAYVLEATGKPVLGVVPYMPDLGLPDEDSVAFKGGYAANLRGGGELDIAVVDLPRASNLTDLDALAGEPDVSLRKVRTADELGVPDAVILPGTRNTMADLRWLRDTGLEQGILGLAGHASIVGICGGYQMLGREVLDPLGLEGESGNRAKGLGLLDIVTELAPEKTLTRTQGRCLFSNQIVEGYEIHHGETRAAPGCEPLPAVLADDGRVLGHCRADGRVYGGYLHGVFDRSMFRRHYLNTLRARKGLDNVEPRHDEGSSNLSTALDRLAGILQQRLDIYRILAVLGRNKQREGGVAF